MAYNDFVKLHPDNPHYFLFRDEALVLITATEHYGSVINMSFDYATYLKMLNSKGFRLTRIFLSLREQSKPAAAPDVKDKLNFYELDRQNTLAPGSDTFLAPWQRSGEPGCCDGGNKFDLTKWNPAFFERLSDFCWKAGKLGIIVEVTLFSQQYTDEDSGPWKVSPMNAINNINGIGAIGFHEFTSLLHDDLTAVQDEFVKRVVNELREFGNVYYEICNEPGTMDDFPTVGSEQLALWQNHFTSLITELEADLPQKHMIALGEMNQFYDLDNISIFNFHYDFNVLEGLKVFFNSGRAISFDETLSGIVSWNRMLDFDGRRREAWEFIMKGCGVYDYLDLTIATDDPLGAGNAVFPYNQHYNGEVMRNYLKILNDFMHSMDFISMKPDNSVIKNDFLAASVNALADKGKTYVIYINGNSVKYLTIELAEGIYNTEWLNTRTGKTEAIQPAAKGGSDITIELPDYEQDIVLIAKRRV